MRIMTVKCDFCGDKETMRVQGWLVLQGLDREFHYCSWVCLADFAANVANGRPGYGID